LEKPPRHGSTELAEVQGTKKTKPVRDCWIIGPALLETLIKKLSERLPKSGSGRSSDWLYHRLGIRGYRHAAIRNERAEIVFRIELLSDSVRRFARATLTRSCSSQRSSQSTGTGIFPTFTRQVARPDQGLRPKSMHISVLSSRRYSLVPARTGLGQIGKPIPLKDARQLVVTGGRHLGQRQRSTLSQDQKMSPGERERTSAETWKRDHLSRGTILDFAGL